MFKHFIFLLSLDFKGFKVDQWIETSSYYPTDAFTTFSNVKAGHKPLKYRMNRIIKIPSTLTINTFLIFLLVHDVFYCEMCRDLETRTTCEHHHLH